MVRTSLYSSTEYELWTEKLVALYRMVIFLWIQLSFGTSLRKCLSNYGSKRV
ncbi:hypothetical protein Mapa_006946 [Marchantia paleacea]|nr:hypothetical protein Mapa_006946 [Marchantia paleacea]